MLPPASGLHSPCQDNAQAAGAMEPYLQISDVIDIMMVWILGIGIISWGTRDGWGG